MKRPTLVDAALLDQERRILRALPAQIDGGRRKTGPKRKAAAVKP